MRASPSAAGSGTVDPAEIRRFAALAEEGWSPDGKFRPLHALNPIRLAFMRGPAVRRFGRAPARRWPLEGLAAIDIGCGGGLLAEPVRRMGARLIGLDADAEGLAVARHHASEVGLEIDYRLGSAEEL